MKHALLVSIVVVASSAPALAQSGWKELGQVSFDANGDREVEHTRSRGKFDRVRFTTRRSGVRCKSVRATFGKGKTRTIFKGRISPNSSRVVDLPGDGQRIKRLMFNCKAVRARRASLRVAGRRDRDGGDRRPPRKRRPPPKRRR